MPVREQSGPRKPGDWSGDPPALTALVDAARTESDLRVAVDRYLLDKAALEHVKGLAPPPGDKPWVILDIARYYDAAL